MIPATFYLKWFIFLAIKVTRTKATCVTHLYPLTKNIYGSPTTMSSVAPELDPLSDSFTSAHLFFVEIIRQAGDYWKIVGL